MSRRIKGHLVFAAALLVGICITLVVARNTPAYRKSAVLKLLERAAGADGSMIFRDELRSVTREDTPILMIVLKDRGVGNDKRMRAAEILGVIGQNDPPTELLGLFGSEPDENVRFYMAYAICWRDLNSSNQEALIRLYNAEKSENVRSLLALKLARLGSVIPAKYLERMTHSELSTPALEGTIGLSFIHTGGTDYKAIADYLLQRPAVDSLVYICTCPVLNFDEKCRILDQFSTTAAGTHEATDAQRLRKLLIERKDLLALRLKAQ